MGAFKEGYAIAIYHSCGCRRIARFPGLNDYHFSRAVPIMQEYRDQEETRVCNDCLKENRTEAPIVDVCRNSYGFAASRQWKLEEAEALSIFHGDRINQYGAIYGDIRYERGKERQTFPSIRKLRESIILLEDATS